MTRVTLHFHFYSRRHTLYTQEASAQSVGTQRPELTYSLTRGTEALPDVLGHCSLPYCVQSHTQLAPGGLRVTPQPRVDHVPTLPLQAKPLVVGLDFSQYIECNSQLLSQLKPVVDGRYSVVNIKLCWLCKQVYMYVILCTCILYNYTNTVYKTS